MIMNAYQTREWLGNRLSRRGPVSTTTWRSLREQGLPVGTVGGSLICDSEVIERWLAARAAMNSSSDSAKQELSGTGGRRPRGRPRKWRPDRS